jgi:hypothetical protein
MEVIKMEKVHKGMIIGSGKFTSECLNVCEMVKILGNYTYMSFVCEVWKHDFNGKQTYASFLYSKNSHNKTIGWTDRKEDSNIKNVIEWTVNRYPEFNGIIN